MEHTSKSSNSSRVGRVLPQSRFSMMLLRSFIILAVASSLLVSTAAAQHVPDITAPFESVCPKKEKVLVSPDEVCHFVVSGVGSAGIYALGRKVGVHRLLAIIGSAALMGTIAYVHETGALYGPDSGEEYSGRDMVWNGLGIVVGLTLTDLWMSRRKARSEPVARYPVHPPPVVSDSRDPV